MNTPPTSPNNTPGGTTWQTLQVASCNVLNLAAPGHLYYPNQDPYDEDLAARKSEWLGAQINRLGADVLGLQEVWDEQALAQAVARSGLRYSTVLAPGAENTATQNGEQLNSAAKNGAEGTPRLGLVTRLALDSIDTVANFAPREHVQVPELGEYTRFERPILRAQLRTHQGEALHVLVAHLKSKRPKYLQDAKGQALEDTRDPLVTARATLRSLLMRAAEAAALRGLVVDILERSNQPLILLGDMNDGPHSVTSQMIAANQTVAYDKAARDTALYHAWDVATEPALKRDMAYSHVHQGWPEMLDQIWVSEEFVATSRFALGDVRRVDVFNDHLHESRERWRSDHGFVRALLRFKVPA